MTWEVIGGLREHLAAAKVDPAVRVVVLAGAGDQAFCAGADLTGMVPGDPGGVTDEYADHHRARVGALGKRPALPLQDLPDDSALR